MRLSRISNGLSVARWAAIGLAAACLITSCRGNAKPLDVILITVDTLRVDHVGALGGTRADTPALDRFAADALVFERAITAAPVTGPSLSTLLTSHYPHETKITDNGLPIAAGLLTLPEFLRNHGYQTWAVLSNPVLRPPGNFSQGFDVYDTDLPQSELARPAAKERRADATTDRAIEALARRDPGRNLFLWVHYIDPHGPYSPPGTRPQAAAAAEADLRVNDNETGLGGIPRYQFIWNERAPRLYVDRYRREVEFLDSQLARLFAVLREPTVAQRSLVIFTADHGESLGEHDYYFAHGEYVYPESIDVPLIVRGPGLGKGRRRDLVGLVDILPSISEYLNIPLPSRVRGTAVFRQPTLPSRTLLTAAYPSGSSRQRFAVLRAGQQLIYSAPDTLEYLRDDKPVTIDAASQEIESLKVMLRRLVQENQLAGMPMPARPAIGSEAAERLRTLGYVW